MGRLGSQETVAPSIYDINYLRCKRVRYKVTCIIYYVFYEIHFANKNNISKVLGILPYSIKILS